DGSEPGFGAGLEAFAHRIPDDEGAHERGASHHGTQHDAEVGARVEAKALPDHPAEGQPGGCGFHGTSTRDPSRSSTVRPISRASSSEWVTTIRVTPSSRLSSRRR